MKRTDKTLDTVRGHTCLEEERNNTSSTNNNNHNISHTRSSNNKCGV